jgi:hypothetical protein
VSDPRDDLAALISEALDHDYEPPVMRLDYMAPFGEFRQAADAIIAARWRPPVDNLHAPLTEIEVRRR